MGENSIERDTQALICGGNSPKRWTQQANSSQIVHFRRTGERQAPGGNRTAIGPVYKEKGAGLMYRLSGDWGTGNGPRAELSVTL